MYYFQLVNHLFNNFRWVMYHAELYNLDKNKIILFL